MAVVALILMGGMAGCNDDRPPAAPTITQQPVDASATVGSTATFTVTATGLGIRYQWQVSTDKGNSWLDVSSATDASYTTGALALVDSGKTVRVVVSAAGITVNSSAVALTVTESVVAPAISVQPAAVTVTEPSHAMFSVTASGTALAYQWQRSTDGGGTWADIGGTDSASHDVGATDPSMSGQWFRVKVSNSAGSLTSAAAPLTVNPAPASPAVTTQPADQSVISGSAAAFTVAATGTPLPTLQWQRSTDGGATWTNVVGGKSSTYNTGATDLAMNGQRFRAVATNGSGSATSNAATLTVNPAPAAPIITSQPAHQSVTAPATATFTAAATGVPTPTWQWQQSVDSGSTWANITGATGASYTTPATTGADDGKRFRAVATNGSGRATTNAATLSVDAGLIAYEGFDYPLGDLLNGKTGGTGWAGAWTVTDGYGNPLADTQSGQIGSGLGYTDAAGNTLVTSGGSWQTDSGVFFGQARRATTASFGAANSSRWISFLAKQSATTSGVNYASISPGTGFSFGSPAMVAGLGANLGDSGYVGVNCFYCATAFPGGDILVPGLVAGSVTAILVRVDFSASGNDTMSIWVNPPLNPATPLGPPSVTASAADFPSALNGLTLSWGDYRSFTYDELRIGTSRSAVTPYRPPAGTGTLVFSTDFGSLPAEINPGTATIVASQGYAALSTPDGATWGSQLLRSETGNVITITLTGLPAHQWLSVDFLLAAIDSLDGAGSYPAGDYYRVTIDGVDAFRESLENSGAGPQTYVPPPGVTLARKVDLGFSGPGGFNTDSAYWMGGEPSLQHVPHTASSVTITLRIEGAGVQDISDESWGMSKLRVRVGP